MSGYGRPNLSELYSLLERLLADEGLIQKVIVGSNHTFVLEIRREKLGQY